MNYDKDNDRLMLICALRYSLGRKTYITSVAVDWVKEYHHLMSNRDKELFIKDIDYHIETDSAGDSVDIDNWLAIKDFLMKSKGE